MKSLDQAGVGRSANREIITNPLFFPPLLRFCFSPLNAGNYEPSLANLDLFPKPENRLFSTGLNSMDYLTVAGGAGGAEQCVAYRDEICAQYLPNQTVIVQSAEKHRINSKRLHNLVAAISSDFKTLSLQCLRHAMSALCHYTYPLCDLDKQQDQVRKRMVSDERVSLRFRTRLGWKSKFSSNEG